MRRYWPYAAVAVAAALAAFSWPLTPAIPVSINLAARLSSAVLAALACAGLAAWSPSPARASLLMPIVCGVSGLALSLMHVNAQTRCLADYEGRPVVIGTEYLPNSAAYVEKNVSLSAADLLFDAGGDPARVWTDGSIRSCARLVTWSGPLAIPLFAAGLAAVMRRRSYLRPVRTTTAPTGAVASPRAALVYDAFISYRHVEPDRAIAFDLVDALEREGLRLAIDVRDFSPNEHFLSEMERCTRESRFVLCVITGQYVQSDHTSEEAIISKTLDLADRRRRLVPLIYERIELPVWLHGLSGVDFTASAAIDPHTRLVQLLKK